MDTKETINCPVCNNLLTKISVDNVYVDVCQDGCGGIWFDNYEIRHFDENFEKAGEILMDIRKNTEINVDCKQKRKCPVCPNSVLMRHFYSPKKEIAVDECPTCGGIWLDTGELAQIRNQFTSEEERKKYKKNFSKQCYTKITNLSGSSEEAKMQNLKEKSSKFAKMFPFLYLSWYIPGKQDGMNY